MDFDLHGQVRIRVEGAREREVRLVERQLGPIQAEVRGGPDITIRFVDAVERDGAATLLGLRDAAFTDTGFLILRSKHKSSARVSLPMDRIGSDHLEILCERGLPAVPLLIAIVNQTMLARGILAMHASAFTWAGRGVMATGWAKGGKTETLLAFAEHGARYVGDEWVYLTPERRMLGIPEPIRLWDWQLREVPGYRSHVRGAERVKLATLRAVAGGMEAGAALGGALGRLSRRARPLVEKQRYVQIEPERLFGNGSPAGPAPLDVLLLVASSEDPEIRVERVDPAEVASRMVFSLQDEAAEFLSCYRKFRFAFPGKANPVIDGAEARQRALLHQGLAGVEAYRVVHPYPVSIPGLYAALEGRLAPGG